MRDITIAAKLIANARGEEQMKLIDEALKKWTFNEINEEIAKLK